MSSKYLRKKIRRTRFTLQRSIRLLRWPTLLLGVGCIMYAGYMEHRDQVVDPTSYRPLLQVIATAESSDNYNAYYGNSSNKDIVFTTMTIGQVLEWQQNFVRQGNPSSAVGRYQIINTTLADLVRTHNIPLTQKFDQATQDQLAIALIERRGAKEYATHKLSKEEFAANLAKEWAALPKTMGDNPEASYYDDGLNTSRVAVAELLGAIQPIIAH